MAVFVHAPGRGGEIPKKVLGTTIGTLVADAYRGELYAVEAQARGGDTGGIRGTPEHLALRQNKSKPVMEEIRTWLDKQKHIARPKSSFGKAVSYMDSQWERLLVFLDDASVPPQAC